VPEFALPDVGEGLTEAEIISWRVRPGDHVAVNDVLVEIETAKSLVELPSPYAGTVAELLVREGETVAVGTPIVRVDTPASSSGRVDDAQPAGPSAQPARPQAQPADGSTREPVLVGYGPRPGRRRRRGVGPSEAGVQALHGAFSTGHEVGIRVAPPEPPHPVSPVVGAETTALPAVGAFPAEDSGAPAGRPLAKPPVRRLARDLGVTLADVVPTGPGGTITRADVEAHAQRAAAPPASEESGWGGLPREERVPVRSVRRATARAVVASAFAAPHVTQFVSVDVSASMDLLDRMRADRRFADVRLSPLTLTARAVCAAAQRTPEVNALWDEDAGEIVYRRYMDLAIATTTPRGLLLPVVRGADRLDVHALAVTIGDLVARARQGTTTPRETSGGTISITNIGVFGMDAGTPIIPPGQSAILALGQVARRPWVVDGPDGERVEPRWVTTLALSFDHRLVDGAQGSAFLADVAGALHDPALAWALG
jgi:pyruvate dehydrogenase E2 component (dihydrolipoamide acetyltransferase)